VESVPIPEKEEEFFRDTRREKEPLERSAKVMPEREVWLP